MSDTVERHLRDYTHPVPRRQPRPTALSANGLACEPGHVTIPVQRHPSWAVHAVDDHEPRATARTGSAVIGVQRGPPDCSHDRRVDPLRPRIFRGIERR